MFSIFTILLLTILLSRYLEHVIKIPFALNSIVIAYVLSNYVDFSILSQNFEDVIFLLLPIVLIPDVLGLSRSELKSSLNPIFYLAFIGVLVSIFLASLLTYSIPYEKSFSFLELVILFTPLMATDVVSISSIFSSFRVPHHIKLYAEGESLFNDVTSMVVFSIVVLSLNDMSITKSIPLIFSKVILLSVLIGVGLGIFGYYLFKFFSESFEQFLSLYLMASSAFAIADRNHLSGILAVVTAVLLFKYLFDKEGHYKATDYNLIFKSLNSESTNEGSFRAYKKSAYYFGLFANGIIFIAIADIIDLELLYTYRYEILYTFLLTTLIRYLIIAPLLVQKEFTHIWQNTLTLAGMKGGLTIIMVYTLPSSFEHKELFFIITVGVVISSMFLYTILLIGYIKINQKAFMLDIAKEKHDTKLLREIKHSIQKEPVTHAYNQLVFEDIIEREILHAQKSNTVFALVVFRYTKKRTTYKIIEESLDKSSSFGKVDTKLYAILVPNTDVYAILDFVKKLESKVELQLGVCLYAVGDTKELIYEKVQSCVHDDKQINIAF